MICHHSGEFEVKTRENAREQQNAVLKKGGTREIKALHRDTAFK